MIPKTLRSIMKSFAHTTTSTINIRLCTMFCYTYLLHCELEPKPQRLLTAPTPTRKKLQILSFLDLQTKILHFS